MPLFYLLASVRLPPCLACLCPYTHPPPLFLPVLSLPLSVARKEEFPDIAIRKTFQDVATVDEFWEFMQGPLLAGLFNLSDGFNPGEGFIYGVNRLLGPVRVRTVRSVSFPM